MPSLTRLVVLGAVRQFQPVHGYFVRRELMTWRIDEWANVQPGSIYNALRVLERDGYIVEVRTESQGRRPDRQLFEVTDEGNTELLRMIRAEMWKVEAFSSQSTWATISFMHLLSRAEVLSALEHRIKEAESVATANNFSIVDVEKSATTPDYVREIFELSTSRVYADQAWANALHDRIAGGAYRFADESPAPIRRTGLNS